MVQPPAGFVRGKKVVGTVSDANRQLFARLDLGVGAESGDVPLAGEFEMRDRLVAHVFHHIDDDIG